MKSIKSSGYLIYFIALREVKIEKLVELEDIDALRSIIDIVSKSRVLRSLGKRLYVYIPILTPPIIFIYLPLHIINVKNKYRFKISTSVNLHKLLILDIH